MAQFPSIRSFLSASLSRKTTQVKKVAPHSYEHRNGVKAVLFVTILRWKERERMRVFNAGRLLSFLCT